ncbi:MAG: Stf0 family sulfotransferase [Proteobacteria bacterium]|nr:Stf0 family sulfotransferase [Pseudomonadota bacterium]
MSKFAKLVKYGEYHARTFAIDLHLSKGSTDFVKFVVLSVSRSGSNLLRDLLNAHSQTMMFGELFRSERSLSWDCPVNDRLRSRSARVTGLMSSDPAALLRDEVFGPTAGHIKALGFKLFYYHACSDTLRPVWSWLQAQRDVRIIQLKRRNSLKRYLSLVKAKRTDVWRDASGSGSSRENFELDFDECLASFEEVRRWEEEHAAFFRDHEVHEIVYEDLASDYTGEALKVQRFLGLSEEAVQPTIYKQAKRPLSESISNYDDLKNRFANTEWAAYFDE